MPEVACHKSEVLGEVRRNVTFSVAANRRGYRHFGSRCALAFHQRRSAPHPVNAELGGREQNRKRGSRLAASRVMADYEATDQTVTPAPFPPAITGSRFRSATRSTVPGCV